MHTLRSKLGSLALLGVGAVALFRCGNGGGGSSTQPPAAVVHDIYASGMDPWNGTTTTIWKNGSPIFTLPNVNGGNGTALAVAGNDVYFSSYVWTPSTLYTYTVYKNGIPTTTVAPTGTASVGALAASGN